MAACRRGCQTSLVALALYPIECQFRTLALPRALVKRPRRSARDYAAGTAGRRPARGAAGTRRKSQQIQDFNGGQR